MTTEAPVRKTAPQTERISIVGWMSLRGSAVWTETPTGKYILTGCSWARLMISGRATWGWTYGSEVVRVMECPNVRYQVTGQFVIIEDMAEDIRYAVRYEDLTNLSEGQLLPVYGMGNAAWKYHGHPKACRIIEGIKSLLTPSPLPVVA